MRTKANILSEITAFGFPGKEVAISMDDFFDNDNCTEGCFGGMGESPGKYYQIFKQLISSGKVNKILVRIFDADWEWFNTDTVYIIGSLSLEELQDSVETLEPDEIQEGWMYGKPLNVNDLENGMKVYSVWWD